MAYNFLTASKDASVYLQQPNQNTGLDEIMEISKVYYGNIKDVSRALIKFDLSSLKTGSVIEEAKLILKETKSEELPIDYTLYAFTITGSWEMGNGTRFDNISTTGVCWNYREGDTVIDWIDNGLTLNMASNPTDGTGGVWDSRYSTSQTFSYQTADIDMDVKSILKLWISGSIQNEGLIIKHDSSKENDTQDYGIVKVFSKETHTIYQPKIRIGWDDQIYITGSMLALDSDEIKVGVSNPKTEYKLGTDVKIKIFARELYPVKTFGTEFAYNVIKYLPKNSYYQIKDVNSDDIIVPFSNYSKISCDENGNYIKINFSNWEADRVYKIEFKIDMDGDIQYFDNNQTFSIVKK
jgi:hypothetical protein